MGKGFFNVPKATNEPIKTYAQDSPERKEVLKTYQELYEGSADIPMYIGAEEVRTKETKNIAPPHEHKHSIGQYHIGNASHTKQAIKSALKSRKKWSQISWEQRAAIFLKAAELVAGPYRFKINAATMLGQSKTIHQAEIDAACQLTDFLRFNVQYMEEIYTEQPNSNNGTWNRLEYRPLEGFIYAITPFNFTSISANLPTSAAMMGNTVVWKPSDSQIYSANVIVEVLKKAGLPDGVINVIYGDAVEITDTVLASPDFSGLHFTGSTFVFKELWKKIGANIHKYKTYPRIVGETGGKDFIIAHPSANIDQVATGITRGAFEFQGQKCSAASRIYLPKSIANKVIELVKQDVSSFSMGSPENMNNFITSVINEASFDKIAGYLDNAKKDKDVEILIGGEYDKSKGYFIKPTILLTTNPKYITMKAELFGPITTIYIFDDKDWSKTLTLVDETSDYALTGAIFSTDRYAVAEASEALENAAGNLYINDKPTGAVVGQQPFGGARASGTNDKAGSAQNLLRWVSPRLIKEVFISPEDFRYPFMK